MAEKNKASAVKVKKGAVRLDKRTMNFVHKKATISFKNILVAIVLLVVVLVSFAKFGILDQVGKRTDAYSKLAAKQEELAAVNSKLGDYDEVFAQYSRYSYGLMSDEEIAVVNRVEVLEIVEIAVANKAIVESFAVNNNDLTLNIYGVTLEEVSKIVGAIESNPYVVSASVNSASSDVGRDARILISVTLSNEIKEAE